MDLLTYFFASFAYLIFWQLVLYMKTEMYFDFLLMVGTFFIGAVVGHILQAYEIGFVAAVVLSLIFL